MTNNNLADISVFESLQSEQHNRTNMSSMSVFNDAGKMKALLAKRLSGIALLIKAGNAYASAQKEGSPKKIQQTGDAYAAQHQKSEDLIDEINREAIAEAARINYEVKDAEERKDEGRALIAALQKARINGLIEFTSGGGNNHVIAKPIKYNDKSIDQR